MHALNQDLLQEYTVMWRKVVNLILVNFQNLKLTISLSYEFL